jgi:pimeloyl-ACP methyl ester carboxylesterase
MRSFFIALVYTLVLAAGLGVAAARLELLPPLVDSLERRFVFDPLPVDLRLLRAVSASASGVEDVRIRTGDGVTLHGWLKRPEHWRAGTRYPLVIVYGGVRREISEFVAEARAPGHWGWLMVNYRGFGLSGGVPTERAVLEDAKRVYDWAAARPDVDAGSIVVLGRSLGSYVAVAVASARRARAAILATPFDSAASLAERYLPHVPLGWLLDGRFDPAALAPRVSAPALFVLAEKDEVTPVENGRALARRWGGRTRTVLLRGATHSGIEAREEFWRSVGEFLAQLSSPAASARAPSTGRACARSPRACARAASSPS